MNLYLIIALQNACNAVEFVQCYMYNTLYGCLNKPAKLTVITINNHSMCMVKTLSMYDKKSLHMEYIVMGHLSVAAQVCQ